eukprot:5601244-Prymnesium_polylepis.1
MKALAEYERRGWMAYAKDHPWAHGRRGLGERREDLVPKLRFSDNVLFCHFIWTRQRNSTARCGAVDSPEMIAEGCATEHSTRRVTKRLIGRRFRL